MYTGYIQTIEIILTTAKRSIFCKLKNVNNIVIMIFFPKRLKYMMNKLIDKEKLQTPEFLLQLR